MDSKVGDLAINGYYAYSYDAHFPGMCGLPLIVAIGNGACIGGIHVAGRENSADSFAKAVTCGEIKEAMRNSTFPLFAVMSESSEIKDYEAPVTKSLFKYENMQNVEYYGKDPGAVILQARSRLVPTPFADKVKPFLNKYFPDDEIEDYGRPVMKPCVKNGTYTSPYNIAARKLNRKRKVLDTELLGFIADKLTDRFITMLEQRGVSSLSPLTIDQAINGVSGDAYTRPINASTSSGYGWKGPKSKHLPMGENGKRHASREVNERLLKVLQCYEKGECYGAVFKAHLKDEPRPLDKVREGKTRVFYMTPLESLILNRMFLMPFYSMMVEHNDIFMTSVGIDMHKGADQFYRDMTDFSPNIVEGDYGSYDQTMPGGIGQCAYTIIIRVLAHFGYTDASIRIVQGLCSDNLFPLVDMLLDIILIACLQPSGKFGTAEDNSLRNLIIAMYIWYSIPELSGLDFFDYVLMRSYGDDISAASKHDAFNNISYQRGCKELLGMDFTATDKGSVMEKFLDGTKMSFLKRKFRFNPAFGRYMAPLDVSSVNKMLSWRMPSQVDTPEEQLESTLQSALWELALNSDAEKHRCMRDELIGWMVEAYAADAKHLEKVLPTHDKIVESICENSGDYPAEEVTLLADAQSL
jgi:hypothetical protein